MINIYTPSDIKIIRECGKKLYFCLQAVRSQVRPGITTSELNDVAEKAIFTVGGDPAFRGYRGFPSTLCVSINEEVIHGIPSEKRKVSKGDLVKLDLGLRWNGFYTDSAITVQVELGMFDQEKRRVVDVTRKALQLGIDQARPGKMLSDIALAIQTYVESQHCNVLREYSGHGIGRQLHEEPQVPNYWCSYGNDSRDVKLKKGMVLAIEPMVVLGVPMVKTLADRWTVVTNDQSLSAHFEHTILVNTPPVILTN